jgi:S-methylmethionine-dependent homocysteine/selenocysteine methylase
MSAGVYRPNRRGSEELRAWLAHDRPLLLDGATGTELERHGVPTPLPLWSAAALETHPDLVRQIHLEYLEAGAELLTANTFRTQRRALTRGGWGDRAAELTGRAVELAREAIAAAARPALVLGSAPTLEDCYCPDRVPDDAALEHEHREHARHLAEAGVDGVWIETINTIRETRFATQAAVAAGLVPLVSFVCGEPARLLSGEPLAEAAAAARAAGAAALGVNCLPPRAIPPCLDVLAREPLPTAAYANLGAPCEEQGFVRSDACDPQTFAGFALSWRERGARLLGGCCGTTPDHIRAIALALGRSPARGAASQ